ncbi:MULTISPECIES: hypothetical protein [Bradyrhizobium]|uniref:hypothetical protein n=1 Tax=Bradyrhizobium TaxID=374 RepID=UPI0004AEF10B|nr:MULTISPECIES: hypothetical protein [unclassified Bradyrhizobium]MDA9426855.1 hypothetical protein [Bradyrhizobium sp. CCBAU 53380]
MTDDFDLDLSPDQWAALRTLRNPLSNGRLKAHLVESLVTLGLAVIDDGVPAITTTGRKVLVRGSCRLLDLVA